jgi:hypothetical protein
VGSVRQFLAALTTPEADVRVERAGSGRGSELRVLLLSAATPFATMCAEAHAVLLCGGTVAPRRAFVADTLGEHVAAMLDASDDPDIDINDNDAAVSAVDDNESDVNDDATLVEEAVADSERRAASEARAVARTLRRRLSFFSCDHVVPPDRVLLTSLDCGASYACC